MNVAQLIEKLQGMPQEAEVAVNTPGGLASIVGLTPFTHESDFGDHPMVVIDNGSIPFRPIVHIKTCMNVSEFSKGEAVDAKVHHYREIHWLETDTDQLCTQLKRFRNGENVKVIITKEDKK